IAIELRNCVGNILSNTILFQGSAGGGNGISGPFLERYAIVQNLNQPGRSVDVYHRIHVKSSCSTGTTSTDLTAVGSENVIQAASSAEKPDGENSAPGHFRSEP